MKVDFTRNYFELFGLPARFAVDAGQLERAYHDLQSTVHPDRHAHLPEAEKRLSMQWATQVNEAYRTLKSPLARAQYLLQLRGVDLQHESNTAMPHDFLMEQMEWREAMGEAREAGDADELGRLHQRLKHEGSRLAGELAHAMDEKSDWEAAAGLTRRLMFMHKLQHDVDEALEALED